MSAEGLRSIFNIVQSPYYMVVSPSVPLCVTQRFLYDSVPGVVSPPSCNRPGVLQLVLTAPDDTLLSSMIDSSDPLHGLCNAVYVAIIPTTAQYTALQTYSATFKVSAT